MSTLTETELKETFGVRVNHPLGMIDYRAYERSVRGIGRILKYETSYENRQKLFKIRRQMKKILGEL